MASDLNFLVWQFYTTICSIAIPPPPPPLSHSLCFFVLPFLTHLTSPLPCSFISRFRFVLCFRCQQNDEYAIVLFRNKKFVSKYDKPFVVYEEESLLVKDAGKWIVKSLNPLVGQVLEDNVRGRYSRRPLVTVLYDIDWDRDAREGERSWDRV